MMWRLKLWGAGLIALLAALGAAFFEAKALGRAELQNKLEKERADAIRRRRETDGTVADDSPDVVRDELSEWMRDKNGR